MVHGIDISGLNLDELAALIAEATALRAEKARTQLDALSEQIEKLKAIVGSEKPSERALKERGSATPQFRYWNKELKKGWTKRGPKPKWVKDLELANGDLEAYAVGSDNEPPIR